MKSLKIMSAIAVVGVCVALGCSARRSEPLKGPLVLNAHEKLGQRVFMRECHQCHPGGDAGVGYALNNKPLSAWTISNQVRRGIGAMPAFDESKISDQEVDAVTDYLFKLRSH